MEAHAFTWIIHHGKTSFVMSAISITRQAEREHSPISSHIMISKALKGPVRRMAAEHGMDCYVIWNFAENNLAVTTSPSIRA